MNKTADVKVTLNSSLAEIAEIVNSRIEEEVIEATCSAELPSVWTIKEITEGVMHLALPLGLVYRTSGLEIQFYAGGLPHHNPCAETIPLLRVVKKKVPRETAERLRMHLNGRNCMFNASVVPASGKDNMTLRELKEAHVIACQKKDERRQARLKLARDTLAEYGITAEKAQAIAMFANSFDDELWDIRAKEYKESNSGKE